MSEEEKKAIEHNRFDTSSGEGEYKITFETNNKNNYLFMQELARLFIDRNYKPKEFERLKLNNEYLQKDCNSLKEIIEKQQKELNKEKEKNKELFLQYEKEVDKLEYQITTMISKDKIRERIEQKRDYIDKELQKANSSSDEEIKERLWCASAMLEELEQELLEE